LRQLWAGWARRYHQITSRSGRATTARSGPNLGTLCRARRAVHLGAEAPLCRVSTAPTLALSRRAGLRGAHTPRDRPGTIRFFVIRGVWECFLVPMTARRVIPMTHHALGAYISVCLVFH